MEQIVVPVSRSPSTSIDRWPPSTTRRLPASSASSSGPSATTDALPADRNRNSGPASPVGEPDADQDRSGWPSGGSTRTTSAPASASSLVA